MRICIDATALLLRSAGVKNYLYHWMRALPDAAPDLSFSAFPLLGEVGSLDHDRSVLTALETYPRIALLHFLNIRGNPAINTVLSGIDVFHASNLMRAIPRKPKLTGTIYDMTVLLHPEFHTAGNVRAETSFYERVLRSADGLIAISESSKADAVRLLSLDPDKIAVIYPGVDKRFFEVTSEEMARVRERYGLKNPYALFVGTVEPRKNVDTLLDAWQMLPSDIHNTHNLVVAGPIGWASGTTVARLKQPISGVRVLGYIPEADLPALTAAASVFVYPSFYEGFGFPVAQAMAAGVPVITSDNSSLKEIAGDAGVLIDPRSAFGLSQALLRLLTSEAERYVLREKGRATAAQFDWEIAAAQTGEFFRQF